MSEEDSRGERFHEIVQQTVKLYPRNMFLCIRGGQLILLLSSTCWEPVPAEGSEGRSGESAVSSKNYSKSEILPVPKFPEGRKANINSLRIPPKPNADPVDLLHHLCNTLSAPQISIEAPIHTDGPRSSTKGGGPVYDG